MSWRNFIVGYFPLPKSVINLPTTYTNKSLQLPVFDKDALDSVILYGRENLLFLELGWGV